MAETVVDEILAAVRAAIEDGITEYRLLRGSEPYKGRFATRDEGLYTVALPGRGRGRVAVAGAALALSAPERMRRPLVKRLG